jgi:hypothetical protein
MKQFFITALFSSFALGAFAQMRTPQTGVSAEWIKMFGDIKAFTAAGESRLLDNTQKEITAMPMTLALREGKLRAEMDISQIKGGGIPPEAAAMVKQAGMDKMVTLILPERKMTMLIYPDAQAYTEMPAKEEVGDKVETTELGKENINGHPCKKVKMVTTDSKGKTHEATIWQATDLKNFPIQMEMPQKSNILIVKFKDPKFDAPAAGLFDIPTTFVKYNNVQELMQAAMMKMLSGGAK